MTQVVGLITARGGSKGIPRKNVVNVAGKPLIAWTITAALGTNVLDRVIVSTDHQRIAESAIKAASSVVCVYKIRNPLTPRKIE